MFDPSTNAPSLSYFQQQATFNPFLVPQVTGMNVGMMAFGQTQPQQQPNPFGMLQPQMTGFVQPQMTGFVQPQMTGMGMMHPGAGGPFLQPQATGTINPFRQSMMMTGTGTMNGSGAGSPFSNALFQPPQQPQSNGPFGPLQSQPTGMLGGSNGPFGMGQTAPSPFISKPQTQPQSPQTTNGSNSPFAPASRIASPPPPVPSTSGSAFASGNAPAALVPQKTGARNPFAPAPGTEIVSAAQQQQAQPTGPSLNAMRWMNEQQQQQTGQQQQQQQTQQLQGGQQHLNGFSNVSTSAPTGSNSPFGQMQPAQGTAFGCAQPQSLSPAPLTQTKTGGLMASIASDFARTSGSEGQQTSPQATGPGASSPFGTSAFSSFSGANSSTGTGTSAAPPPPSQFSSLSISTTGTGTGNGSFLTPQRTGFGGSTMKPFQPTSSFGSQLASEFGTTGADTAAGSNNTLNAFSNQSQSQPFSSGAGSTLSSPLQSQSTGFGSGSGFNPFRSGSVLPPLNGSLGAGLGSGQNSTPFSAGGSGTFGGGGNAGNIGQVQPASGSLI